MLNRGFSPSHHSHILRIFQILIQDNFGLSLGQVLFPRAAISIYACKPFSLNAVKLSYRFFDVLSDLPDGWPQPFLVCLLLTLAGVQPPNYKTVTVLAASLTVIGFAKFGAEGQELRGLLEVL